MNLQRYVTLDGADDDVQQADTELLCIDQGNVFTRACKKVNGGS